MAEKAQKEKEKGNAAFKAGDYPTAIGHYSAAILVDRKDITYSLNRAAAYLKLGKYEDAERDCSSVLNLSTNNVKAYFRRGQAKVGLRKFVEAQRDFTNALRLEPDNQATKEELKKVAESIEIEKRKKQQHHTVDVHVDASPQLTPPPRRRRVPITIVEPPAASSVKNLTAEMEHTNLGPGASETTQKLFRPHPSSDNDEMKAVSSRPLKPPVTKNESEQASSQSAIFNTKSAVVTAPPSTANMTSSAGPKTSSFKEAKQARESVKTSRVGGGIFRASGQSTIFPTRNDGGLSSPHPAPPSPASPETQTLGSGEQRKSTLHKESTPSASSVTSHAPEPQSLPYTTAISELESRPSNSSPSKSQNNGVSLMKPPATLFDFNRDWRMMLTSTERWSLIQTIPASSMPSFCKTSLEPTLLISILETFLVVLSSHINSESPLKVKEYMDGLAKVPRFSTLVLLLSAREKEIAKQVWRKLGVSKAPGAWDAIGSLNT